MKFLLVEDHAVFRYGIAKLLWKLPGDREFLENLSNKEIAEALGMRVNTVRVHLAAIFRTLGVANRVDAARAALNLRRANAPQG